QDRETWERAVAGVFRRGLAALGSACDDRSLGLWKNTSSGFRFGSSLAIPGPTREARHRFELSKACETSWISNFPHKIIYKNYVFIQSLDRDLDRAFDRDLARDPDLARELTRELTLGRARDLDRDLDRDLTRDLTRDLDLTR